MQMLVRDGENQYLRQLCDEENLESLSKFQRRICISSADGIDMNVPLYSSHIGVTQHEKNERVGIATNDEQKNKLWLDNHQREMKSKLDQLDWTRITLRFNVPWHLYPFAHPIILQNTLYCGRICPWLYKVHCDEVRARWELACTNYDIVTFATSSEINKE